MQFERFDNSTKSFLDSGFVEGLPLNPDAKHTVLRQGLLDYYNTYHSLRGNFYEYLHPLPNGKVEMSQAKGHQFLMLYFSGASFIQLFIELAVKEILENINPILVTGKLNNKVQGTKESRFITYISSNDLERFEILGKDHTVAYSTALDRLIKLINSESSPANFKVDPKYHFFAQNKEMLYYLAEIRNEIIHKADRVISKYSWELLFVNYIIPFINTWLDTQDNMVMLKRRLHRGINILDSLSDIKLNVNYHSGLNYNTIQKNLRHINHLKELGRASYNNPIHMYETLSEEDRNNATEDYQDSLRKKSVAEILECKKQYVVKMNVCPCCGLESNGVFLDYCNDKFAYCENCTYLIYEKELGDPYEFELTENKVFD